jgi:hypothetical protein
VLSWGDERGELVTCTKMELDDEERFTLEEEGCSVLQEVVEDEERAGLLRVEDGRKEMRSERASDEDAEEAAGAGAKLLRRLSALPFIRQYAGTFERRARVPSSAAALAVHSSTPGHPAGVDCESPRTTQCTEARRENARTRRDLMRAWAWAGRRGADCTGGHTHLRGSERTQQGGGGEHTVHGGGFNPQRPRRCYHAVHATAYHAQR